MAANNGLDNETTQAHTQAQIEIALRNPYTYRPLSDVNEEIRVVKIMAGNGVGNKIECDIEHCLLSEEGDGYEAISYVWGEPIRNHNVLCDNGKSHLKVTSNLREVIERLASMPENDGHQRYWVDSICINQDNSAERDSQVKRMAKIYGYSKRVHVFLGTVEPGRHPATSSWFSRRWVIQEYLNARMSSIHYNRQDMWYHNEYQALAPESVAIGDQVILPIGAPTPFVLRQDESANYTLVSNCWVTGDPTSVLPPAQNWIMNADCEGGLDTASIRDYLIL
ncbi:hypothetical protein J4E89_000726 [Alternaria sp. Ai002NY15]|nr:hypothetical protein J4E89_000726 [Alternaria sp. Ai002NY15]